MAYLIRVLCLVAAAACGFFLIGVTASALIVTGAMPTDAPETGFGPLLMQRAIWVWMGSIVFALAGVPINGGWRWLFLLAPLYAPSLSTVILTLSA